MTKHFLKKPRPVRGRGLRLRVPQARKGHPTPETRGAVEAPAPTDLELEESPLEQALGAVVSVRTPTAADPDAPPAEAGISHLNGVEPVAARTSPPDSAMLQSEPAPPSSGRLDAPDVEDTPDAGPGGDLEETYEPLPVRPAAPRKLLLGVVVTVGILAGALVGNMAVSKLRGPRPARNAAIARAPDPEAAPPSVPLPPPPVLAASTTAPASTAEDEYHPPAATADEAKAQALREQALDLLNRRKNAEVLPVARAAIEADPLEALGYLYLGSALQDSGKWKDAMSVYQECVRTAKKGIVDECRAMVGRRNPDEPDPLKRKR